MMAESKLRASNDMPDPAVGEQPVEALIDTLPETGATGLYSKNMGQTGLLVHSCISIGYDVPWQTVNELLISAARRTRDISSHPEPFVLQVSLEDNYVVYEVNGWTRKSEELPRIYSELHANILDEFHGHKIEITSPAYRAVRDGNAPAMAPVIAPQDPGEGGGRQPA